MAVDSGSYTDATMESRRRLAEAMMKQGMDTSPIQSHYQGLARLANALFGGMNLNRIDEQSKERDKAYAETLLKTLDGASGGTAQPAASKPSWDSTVTAGEGSNAKVIPASIRTNNPGAQWPGPSAAKFGSTESQTLKDGNKIAVFKSPEDGAAAQFDLLGRRYAGKTLTDAIAEWSGGNNVDTYVGAVSAATGINPNEPITPELLRSPKGIQLAKAMAQHEAGRPGALDDETWARAQARAFGNDSNSTVQAVPAQGQQTAQATQMPATGVPAGSGTQSAVNPQVRARIEALVRSPDPRARAMGEKLVQSLIVQGVKPSEFGKAGMIFQGPDSKFYSMQFGANGQKIVEPVEIPGADGKPVALSPAKGVKQVGDELVSQATGETVRNVAPAIAGKEKAEEIGKAKGQREVNKPKAVASMTSLERQWDLVDKTLDEAIDSVGYLTTGMLALGNKIPGTPGYNLERKLETIRGNIGFDKLAEMRANSPTGAALGAVSDFENRLLQAIKGSTDTGQSPGELAENLKGLKRDFSALRTQTKRQFDETYGGQEAAPAGKGTAAPDADGWTTLPNGVRVRERR